jgi:hypothetical protein
MKSGWYGERYRHYLAAKGIKTNTKQYYFMGKISGKHLPIQRHHGTNKFDSTRGVRPVESSYMPTKPVGGFWTTSVPEDPKQIDSWERFTGGEWPSKHKEIKSKGSVVVIPHKDANIFQINEGKDLKYLWDNYAETENLEGKEIRKINWKKVAEDYDAVHLSEPAFWELRMPELDEHPELLVENGPYGTRKIPLDVYPWDAESTVWFKKKFDVPLENEIK